MKKTPGSLVYLLLSFICLSALPAKGETVPHLVLISIDGLRPEFYLNPSWPAPMIQQMAREGAFSRAVISVFPSVTYPSHTTMVTGVRPARHGIFYNSPFEPGGQTGRWFWEEESIRVPTLWDALRAAGLKSAAVFWPVSVGAPIDWNVPEVWPVDRGEDPIESIRRAATPAGLLQEIEREATGLLTPKRFNFHYLDRDDQAAAAAAYLLEKYRPNLLAAHFIEADHFQHEKGKDAPMVRRAVAADDRGVSRIVEAAKRAGILAQTAFVVVGDHGFIDLHTQIACNRWLIEAGLLEDQKDRGNWRAAFHVSGSSAFLQLRQPGDKEAVALVRQVLKGLPMPLKRLFDVVEREELDRLGVDPSVPLALSPRPGIDFTDSTAAPLLRPAQGGGHGFHPELEEMHTGFIAWGAGIRAGAVVPVMGLEDVAPVVAELLGVSFEGHDGVLPAGILMRQSPSRKVE